MPVLWGRLHEHREPHRHLAQDGAALEVQPMRLQTRHQGRSQEPQALLPPKRGDQVYVHQQWVCLLFPFSW